MGLPNMLITMLTRYSSAMPPVAAITPSLNFSVALMTPDRYATSMQPQHSEGEPDGLDDDARVRHFEDRRQAADHESLEQRIDRRT